jgi:hypothetical protein
VTETALKRVKSFERLSFLYLLLGDTDKLGKMLKIAELRTDVLSRCVRADQSPWAIPTPRARHPCGLHACRVSLSGTGTITRSILAILTSSSRSSKRWASVRGRVVCAHACTCVAA